MISRERQCVCVLVIFAALGTLYTIKQEEAQEFFRSIVRPAPPTEYQIIPECGCQRPFLWPPSSNSSYKSSCSDKGTFYHNKQNVFSFTFYATENDNSRALHYITGILLNLESMRKFYPPGYTMRVYTDKDLEGPYCNLICENSDLFWCDIRNTPLLGNKTKMTYTSWRFLPLADPTVETFHSRDLDSRITAREAAVVADWVQLNKPFYCMRDAKGHHDVAVMAGMWGGNNSLISDPVKLRDELVQETEKGGTFWGVEQDILHKLVFNSRGQKEFVGYDSYHCTKWADKQNVTRPFPMQRINNETDFVGNQGHGKSTQYPIQKCPEECRPSYGKDWEYC